MRSRHSIAMIFGVALAALGSGCASGGRADEAAPTADRAPVPRSRGGGLPPPSHLSATARSLIGEWMSSHGDDMTVLLWAVLFLDYDSIHNISSRLENEPRLSRPLPDDDSTLNASLPEKFFQLQDDFAAKAKSLVAVAGETKRDPVAVAAAYGALTETCVRCHAVYLDEVR